MSWEVANPELDPKYDDDKPSCSLKDMPESWEGYTREQKAQIILNVVEEQMRIIRNGEFNNSTSEWVAALSLEGQLCLADFYADSEADSKNAKHIAEYIEAEAQANLSAKAIANGEKRPSEVALKRQALISQEVKDARRKAVELEKVHKKWRCVLDILKDAHVFFRRMSTD